MKIDEDVLEYIKDFLPHGAYEVEILSYDKDYNASYDLKVSGYYKVDAKEKKYSVGFSIDLTDQKNLLFGSASNKNNENF